MGDQPLLPSHDGACITNVVRALLDPCGATAEWLPRLVLDSEIVVLLVMDGLGWEQLAQRRRLAPTLSGMEGCPLTTVAPSTTATALTSLTTGLPPGEHGIVGYRMAVHGEVLNVLRWSTATGDACHSIPPTKIQAHVAFDGQRPPVVTRAEFRNTGFTQAHLDGVRFTGYRTLGTLTAEIGRLTRAGEPFVYAYYDGLDKVSHEYGLAEQFDEELRWIDHLVGAVMEAVPPGAVVVVTSDHGQVEVGDNVIELPGAVMEHVAMQSGEGRFRWLHCRPGRGGALLDACTELLGEVAWVRSREEAIADQWYGPVVTEVASSRLGDVLLAARKDVAFDDPLDTGPYKLVGRHGSLTSAEMLVPLLAGRG